MRLAGSITEVQWEYVQASCERAEVWTEPWRADTGRSKWQLWKGSFFVLFSLYVIDEWQWRQLQWPGIGLWSEKSHKSFNWVGHVNVLLEDSPRSNSQPYRGLVQSLACSTVSPEAQLNDGSRLLRLLLGGEAWRLQRYLPGEKEQNTLHLRAAVWQRQWKITLSRRTWSLAWWQPRSWQTWRGRPLSCRRTLPRSSVTN